MKALNIDFQLNKKTLVIISYYEHKHLLFHSFFKGLIMEAPIF